VLGNHRKAKTGDKPISRAISATVVFWNPVSRNKPFCYLDNQLKLIGV
jgi:hypothetical protein